LGNAYARNVFDQDWNLFAPNPDHANEHVRVRLRLQDKSTTRWLDLTAFFVDHYRRNRLTAQHVVLDSVGHAAIDALSRTSQLRDIARVALYRTAASVVEYA
jgi:hypothetical protein